MSISGYLVAEKGESRKLDLATSIDEAMKYAVIKERFIRLMEMEGYEVNWKNRRKYITYTCLGGMICRGIRLHEEKYLKEVMEDEFRIRKIITDRIKGSNEDEMDRTAQTISFMVILKRLWKALIDTQTAQIGILNIMFDQMKNLTNWKDIADLQKEQIKLIIVHTRESEQMLTGFQEILWEQTDEMQGRRHRL